MKKIICAVGILLAAFTASAIDSEISKGDFISIAYSSIKADSITFCTFEDVRFAQYNDEEGNPVFFIISSDFSKPKGYEGFTNVGINLDTTGTVLSVKILTSEDTPSFVKRVKRKWFLNQFIGYSDKKDIKMITGATKTCKAVKISIEEAVEKFVLVMKFLNQKNNLNKKKISLTKKLKSAIKIIALKGGKHENNENIYRIKFTVLSNAITFIITCTTYRYQVYRGNFS